MIWPNMRISLARTVSGISPSSRRSRPGIGFRHRIRQERDLMKAEGAKVPIMSSGSVSEKTRSSGRTVLSRVRLVLPMLLFVFVALSVAFVASKTVRQPYETSFAHLFFSDTLHMKAWLITAVSLLALGQLLTASRIYEMLRF